MSYIHLGEDTAVYSGDIIGIFDIDTTTVSGITREFLNTAEKQKRIKSEPGVLPRSFVVCKNKRKDVIYLSPINTSTLKKRG